MEGDLAELLLKPLEDLLREVELNREATAQCWKKDDGTFVSTTDLHIQQRLKNVIRLAHPDIPFVCEEETSNTPNVAHRVFSGEVVAVIDPIDGTDNFLSGFPLYAISIGFMKAEGGILLPKSAIVVLPALGKIFYSRKGSVHERNFFLGTDRIVSPLTDTAASPRLLMLTQSFYAHCKASSLNLDGSLPLARTTGSTVVDILFTGLGISQCAITAANLWDVAGALSLAQLLGARIWRLTSGEVISGFLKSDFAFDTSSPWRLCSYYVISREAEAHYLRKMLDHREIDFSALLGRHRGT